MNFETTTNSVLIPAVPEHQDMVSGRFPPQRIRIEPTDSVNILIRSEDRRHGNDFDFTIDLIASTAHIRKIQLSKFMGPLLPQVNQNNKYLTIVHADGTITTTLTEGYYSVQSFVNMLQSALTVSWSSLGAGNIVTVSYNIERRSISVVDNNGEQWYFASESTFILYGRNVVKFPSKPIGSPLTSNITESQSLGMIYSRFLILTSNRLTEDQKTYSTISGKGPSNIVSIIDLSSQYSAAQFAVSSSFPGTEIVADTLAYSPRINVLNRNKALKLIDLTLDDEFGFKVSSINTPTYTFEYPVAMWFQCYL